MKIEIFVALYAKEMYNALIRYKTGGIAMTDEIKCVVENAANTGNQEEKLNSEDQPVSVDGADHSRHPVISKSRVIRKTLSNEEYLRFHEIEGRLVFFGEKLNARQVEEKIIDLAINRLYAEVALRVASGETFIFAESLQVGR